MFKATLVLATFISTAASATTVEWVFTGTGRDGSEVKARLSFDTPGGITNVNYSAYFGNNGGFEVESGGSRGRVEFLATNLLDDYYEEPGRYFVGLCGDYACPASFWAGAQTDEAGKLENISISFGDVFTDEGSASVGMNGAELYVALGYDDYFSFTGSWERVTPPASQVPVPAGAPLLLGALALLAGARRFCDPRWGKRAV